MTASLDLSDAFCLSCSGPLADPTWLRCPSCGATPADPPVIRELDARTHRTHQLAGVRHDATLDAAQVLEMIPAILAEVEPASAWTLDRIEAIVAATGLDTMTPRLPR